MNVIPRLDKCKQSRKLFCLQVIHNNLVLLWFCFRFRASSQLSMLATLWSSTKQICQRFHHRIFNLFSFNYVDSSTLIFLRRKWKIFSLSLSAAAAFVTEMIKASSLKLPEIKHGLNSLSTYGLATPLPKVLRKSCWTRLGSYVMWPGCLDATTTFWMLLRISRQRIT